MEIIKTVKDMKTRAGETSLAGKKISFVPTMGFLHEGHLTLLRTGKTKGDVLVLSIFVNPIQFGPNEDFEQYPRDTKGDLEKAESAGVDIVFMPSYEEMYPDGFQTGLKIGRISQPLCGLSRPGHFDGVATVVCKLFNIVEPGTALFGQKDFQQLAVIKRMVKDLNMGVEIISVPIVREPDGLAMSSRNKYLSPNERLSALCLKKSIDLAIDCIKGGERESFVIISGIREFIKDHPFTDIDYISICDPLTLENKEKVCDENLIALAVRVGKTRLIDNCLININGLRGA